jgi:hypothetical protein
MANDGFTRADIRPVRCVAVLLEDLVQREIGGRCGARGYCSGERLPLSVRRGNSKRSSLLTGCPSHDTLLMYMFVSMANKQSNLQFTKDVSTMTLNYPWSISISVI